ncbi:hypothetical protein THAOC_33693, partial [Thalassiosira oceanica]
MSESERADNSALEYTSPLPPWCTSGQYWPSPDGPVYRASSRWVSCFLASVTLGPPMQGLCMYALVAVEAVQALAVALVALVAPRVDGEELGKDIDKQHPHTARKGRISR